MKPKRVQRKRTRGWKMPPNTVYVGRGSSFGNPFIEGTYLDINVGLKITPEIAVALYRHLVTASFEIMCEFWQSSQRATRDEILKDIEKLRGKDLACWCELDEPCHVDVLLELANE